MCPTVGSRARALHAVRLSVLLLGLALAGPAWAQGFASPLVGGFVFSGPASPHVSSIYYNPAAIGIVDGTAFHLSFHSSFDFISIDRAPIDPATGAVATPGTPGARRRANDLALLRGARSRCRSPPRRGKLHG